MQDKKDIEEKIRISRELEIKNYSYANKNITEQNYHFGFESKASYLWFSMKVI